MVAQFPRLKSLHISGYLDRDFGNYVLDERPPVATCDPATIERHDRAVKLYRNKAMEAGNQTAWRLG